jgi:(p)ppGpp synthase/HD superfamily hydrolase
MQDLVVGKGEVMGALAERAKLFATAAHHATGQKRKYTGEPYIVHPSSVANIVLKVCYIEDVIAAAYLHDVVEDTHVTIDIIREEFGESVAKLVEELTDVSTLFDGNRADRKRIDREHTALASPHAKTIKLADLIDNSKTIIEHDKKFAKVYLAEKRLLLEVLTEGHPALLVEATRLLLQCEERLKNED